MDKMIPTQAAIEEAKKHPNGWVYVIDSSFENEPDVPPQAIVGAWKVNEKGEITGDFVPNPNYINLKNL